RRQRQLCILVCEYGDEPGVAVALVAGFDQNIAAPWEGDYTITVAGDLSTITLTTDTPKPEGPVAIYLRGAMNDWGAPAEWAMTATSDENIYKFVCAEEQAIKAGIEFKIADSSWSKINVGGEPLMLDVETLVFNGGNPANMTLDEDWNGVCWLNLDLDGQAYVVFSNDKEFVPEWGGNTPAIPDPIYSGPLYITGAGDFANGAWNAAHPDEFTYADGKYTIKVDNLSMFKISTTCDPATADAVDAGWTAFDEGVRGCDYGTEPGVEVALEEGYTMNINTPWEGNYTITVAGDLSTIILTTDTPKPEGPVAIYLRGDMNGWGADEAWMMTPTEDENVFKFVCAEDQEIAVGDAFKIADASWAKYNIGGNGEPASIGELTEVFNGGNPANITLAENWNGVCWLNLNYDDHAYIILSNDKDYIPDWNALGGIANVELNSGDVKYFNLQGVQVVNPERGIYIVVRNGQSRKVMVK
ncbi:MAG: hypothetical protein K2G23_04140, partial [Muribaculaceae bacterium]|nr:hypothetical protein [Muribaculaceae bacterium]